MRSGCLRRKLAAALSITLESVAWLMLREPPPALADELLLPAAAAGHT